MDDEAKSELTEKNNLLSQAQAEITQLRNRLQMANGKLEVFDKMMLLFTSYPNNSGDREMTPDLVWEIQRHLNKYS